MYRACGTLNPCWPYLSGPVHTSTARLLAVLVRAVKLTGTARTRTATHVTALHFPLGGTSFRYTIDLRANMVDRTVNDMLVWDTAIANMVDSTLYDMPVFDTAAADAAIAGFILSGIALMMLILALSVRINPDGSGISVQLKVTKSRPSTPNSGVAMNALAASGVATAITSPGTSVVVTPERRAPESNTMAGYPGVNYAPDRWQVEQQQQQLQPEMQAPPQALQAPPPPPPAFPPRPAENAV